MNTFKRKSLYAALAGVSALGATGAADAVNINPDGLGQVLLYPYFTVRGSTAGKEFNTLMSVINTTPSVKVVKVRFLEGKNSKEVIDFNLFLSPNDVWVAAVIPTSDGAKLVTGDQSCTDPGIIAAQGGRADNAVDFVNYAYAADPVGGTVDRVREGYFEIIEMGPVANLTVANAATHNSAGVPANCALVRSVDAGVGLGGTNVVTPNGGLFGSESLINVQLGTDYTADPVALDNWQSGLTGTTQWTAPGSLTPNLSNVADKFSVVFVSGAVAVVPDGGVADWGGAPTNAADAVSAVLIHENIYNEFVLDTITQSGTDWVVTFPTKTFYYPGAVINNQISVTNLFQRNFTSAGACDDISVTVFDREERFVNIVSFSPPLTQTFSICWEANVITFNNSNVLSSVNKFNIATSFQNGWMNLGFPLGAGTGTVVVNNHQLRNSASGRTYFGLPAIGFAVASYTNGFVPAGCAPGTCALSNYGGNWIHKSNRSIVPLP
jgi:hypothetical protein